MKFKSRLSIWHWLSSSKGTVHFTTMFLFYLEDRNTVFLSVLGMWGIICCAVYKTMTYICHDSLVIHHSKKSWHALTWFQTSAQYGVYTHPVLICGFNARKPILSQFLLPQAPDIQSTQNWHYVKIPLQKLAESQFYTFHQGTRQRCLTKGRSWRLIYIYWNGLDYDTLILLIFSWGLSMRYRKRLNLERQVVSKGFSGWISGFWVWALFPL